VIRVFLLNEHDLARHAARAALDAAAGVDVVGESRYGGNAVSAVTIARSEVLVAADPQTSGGDGLHACRRIRAVSPSVRLVLVAAQPDERLALWSCLLGASEFVRRQSDHGPLVEAVRGVAGGRTVSMDLAWPMAKLRADGPAVDDEQRTLLQLLAGGLTDRQIAGLTQWSEWEVASRIVAIAETCGLLDGVSAVLTGLWAADRTAGGERRPSYARPPRSPSTLA
jgi:DNA-binding NarL/FixJ family response regulator